MLYTTQPLVHWFTVCPCCVHWFTVCPCCQPITTAYLTTAISFLDHFSPSTGLSDVSQYCYLCVLLFASLQCECTSHSMSLYDPASVLLFQDIRMTNDCRVLHIHIKKSKTDPFHAGCTIRIGTLGTHLWPVVANLLICAYIFTVFDIWWIYVYVYIAQLELEGQQG